MKTLLQKVKFVLTAALLCATSFAFGDAAPSWATPAVSNLVKKLSWCSLGTSITDFNDNPITGRTQGYQFFTMDKLGWSHDKLTDSGHSGACISAPQSKPPETPCDIYTIEFGVNDWCKGYPVGTLDDYKNYLHNGKAVRYNLFAACYRNLIEMIRKVNPNAAIVLMTPRKAYGSSEDGGTKMFPSSCDGLSLADQLGSYYDPVKGTNVPGEQTHLKDYADLIKEIGEYEGFLVVDWYAEAATEENLAALSVDVAVHPNDAGYEIMADLLAPKILEAVSRIDFRKGCGEEEEVVIPKIVDIVALRNVAVATAVGSAPALPATVKGLFANGVVSDGDYVVTWDEVAAPAEEGVTTVSGTATVEGKSMSVTAFVRAENASSSGGAELVNIAQRASSMIVTSTVAKAPEGSEANITNGWEGAKVVGNWEAPGAGWRIWTGADSELKLTVDFAWEESKNISKIFVATWDDKETTKPTLKDGPTGEVLVETSYANNGNNHYKSNAGQGHLFVFATPIKLSQLRVEVSKDYSKRFYGFYEIEVWAEDSSGPAIEPLTTDTLSALEVDGVAVAGFVPTTYSYEVENGETITAASATDNMGITILPKYDGAAYAVTLAEDGESTKTYAVSMPSKAICPHEHQTIVDAVDPTCTTDGSTRSVYCEDCKTYLETAEVIPALGHLWSDWEVTKNPTTTEAGSKHRVCQRPDCGEEEVKEIPMLKPFVALRNVAGVAGVGHAFILPTTVKGIDANGALTDDLDVVWPSATVAYDAPGLYTIDGCASVDPTKKVTATIRVVPISTAYANVSPEATPDTSATDRKNLALLVSDTLPDTTWITTNGRNGDFWDKLTWPTAKTISYVDIYYQSGHTIDAVAFETETGAAIDCSKGETQQFTNYQLVRYTFARPASVTALKCTFTGPSGKYVTVNRIWAYESEGESEIVPSSNAALSDLKVDDKTVIDFAPEKTEYTAYNGNAITAATADDNVMVTILPKNDEGNAFVITMAEDGIATKTYTVAMPTVNIAALRNIALVVGVDMELSLPNTVMALTPTGEIIGEMPVEWIDAPSSYATAGKYTVIGRAKADASLTVAASIRVLAGENVGVSNAARNGEVDAYIIQPSGDPEQHKNRAYLTDGLIPNTPDWNSRVYSRPNAGTPNCDMEVTLTFQRLEQIEKVCVYYEVGSYVVASGVKFYDANGNEIAYSAPNVFDYSANVKKYEYVFAKPQILPSLKMVFSNTDQKFISLIETEAWTTGMLVPDLTPSPNSKPDGIICNGNQVKNFDPDNTEKVWRIGSRKNITLDSDDNIALTILPEDENKIMRAVTLSEDGTSTMTYKLECIGGLVFFIH